MELDELIKELDRKLIVISKEIKDDTIKKYLESNIESHRIIFCFKDFKNIMFLYKPEKLDNWIQETKKLM